ncbi:disease resistance protein RPS2-like [Typha angustifolia]|uniref:disease resistance protein RPS2-like n=1 Tax=Typha angustifolia TaxID=59011 RepID=UPI003C30B58F
MAELGCQGITTAFSCINETGLPAAASEEASSFLCLETNWRNLKKAIEDLKATETRVKDKVELEVNQLNLCDPQVGLWLRRVADYLEEEVEITEEDYNKLYRCYCLCNCTPNLFGRYRLGSRVADKVKDVNKFVEEGKQFKVFGYKPQPDIVEERPKTRTFGLESLMTQLREYFDNKEKSIIGIWGQGGVGKTTLLNEFNNELKNRSGDFHVVIAMDVSNAETLNVADMQRMIADRLGLPWNETDKEDTRAKFLAKALGRRKFAILLDDVRRRFRLEDVGIPTPDAENNCKLILSSRFQDVCIQMGAQQSLIEMQMLDEKAAWDLFRSNLSADAIAAIDDSPDRNNVIQGYAKAIAQNCGGLPLALNIIGRAVAGLKDSREWKYAMDATKANPAKITGVNEMFSQLKYSYDRLNQQLKQLFLYCTLFPEYGWIKKGQLVDYWMAEGLIPNADPNQGRYNIRMLVSACLLQSNDSEDEVKMHHIIRHLGLWLATEQGEFLVQTGLGLEDAPGDKLWREATRISLMSNNIKDISISPKCKNLRTLLVQNNRKLTRLSPHFFASMPSLRVLDLSYTAITELPACDALIKLRHLNLRHTRIVKLPENFSVMKQLRNLDLSITSALENTSDNCSKLLKLRVLNLFRSKYGIRDVNDLNIDTLEKLEFLGITIHAQEVLSKLKKKHPLARSTRWLSLQYCSRMEKIQISELKKMVHLEELYIESCDDLKELTADADERQASCLQDLTLAALSNLHTVSVGKVPHHFQNLRNLTIHKCHKLCHVTWVLQLESLEKLVVSHCDGMIQIVKEQQNEKPIDLEPQIEEGIQEAVEQGTDGMMHCTDFPKLRSIVLNDLKLLESICAARDFSCLESIRVEACPKLRRLPVSGNYKMLKLKQICGSYEWWEQLIWEDMNIEVNSMNECFIPI